MTSNNKTPLGFIELSNGAKAIFPMNDFFLTYTFEKPEHWESLRLTVNLMIEAYKKFKPETRIKPITGKIKVETQFKHLMDVKNTTRDQDMKITEDETKAHYIEFHNRARSRPPVEIRSVEYFGLGIGHSKGKIANQIWLLAEDVDSVLHGKTFTRYILKDEVTEKIHPATSGIMYISLTKLSQENTPAGELALFLLGKISEPEDETVKEIVKTFNAGFNALKTDKEVVNNMSLAERFFCDGLEEGFDKGVAQGVAQGVAKGVVQGVTQLLELINKGIDPNEAARMIAAESESLDSHE
ncbi:MAG: hypothetical protein LBI27_09390 [Clostridiales bacterium]|jgi:hypothetical protein|nr:hypothetical protein [Clostridiales bacterium]